MNKHLKATPLTDDEVIFLLENTKDYFNTQSMNQVMDRSVAAIKEAGKLDKVREFVEQFHPYSGNLKWEQRTPLTILEYMDSLTEQGE